MKMTCRNIGNYRHFREMTITVNPASVLTTDDNTPVPLMCGDDYEMLRFDCNFHISRITFRSLVCCLESNVVKLPK